VYVAPPHRLQGLYKALYAHVRREAAAAGACGLRLYADDSNAIAQESYKKLGMTSHYRVFEDMFTAY
jgi:GNAT superfamily N-acetyltransferase